MKNIEQAVKNAYKDKELVAVEEQYGQIVAQLNAQILSEA